MGGDDRVGHAQKALGNDPSDFEAIEILFPHFSQDSLQCVLDLLCSNSAKEHHLNFCRHEKEVPAGGLDFAIKAEAIQRFELAPVS
jgi:hypothetical protein